MPILGTWYNELGSVMTITSSTTDGTVAGIYSSAVGDAQFTYQLIGRYDVEPSSSGQAVGWTVAWLNQYGNSHSATSWTGQYQIDPQTNQEEINTFWLLVTEEPPSQDWAATNIGHDTFTRSKPDAQTIERARKLRRSSHPMVSPRD